MNRTYMIGAVILALGSALIGCNNTGAGLEKDAADNTQKVQQTADNAAVATKQAADKAAVATENAALATKQAAENTAVATKTAAEHAVVATKTAADKVGVATEHAAVATKQAADNAVVATKSAADKAAVATENAAHDVSHEAKVGAKNTTAALEVTPKVKNALVMDKDLNDTRNHINVDSANNVVHLKGHVISDDLKARAGDIATKTLKEMNATDTVSNELTVSGK